MPTGYTAKVYDGSDTTLRGYILSVARGMGYAIEQRDDNLDVPIRRVESAASYSERSLALAKERIEWLKSLTEAEVAFQASEANAKAQTEWQTQREAHDALQARYESMIEQVEAWQPDPLIESTKEFALKQLHESLRFDCGYVSPSPELLSPEAWLAGQMDAASRSIGYSETEIAKARERADDRNRHIDALYASLPAEVQA